jgi:hypothetical protein
MVEVSHSESTEQENPGAFHQGIIREMRVNGTVCHEPMFSS